MNKTQGKRICDILKEIRNKVANEESIDLNQTECTYKGECSGTCPKCEAELAKINDKVSHKKLSSIFGCIAIIPTLVGCGTNTITDDIQGDIIYRAKDINTKNSYETLETETTLGEIEPDIYMFPEDENFPSKEIQTLEDLEEDKKDIEFENPVAQGVIMPDVNYKK